MHNNTKRKIPLALVGVLILIILTACGKTPEEKYTEAELDFVATERIRDYVYAYYESPEDKEYYRISITSYQYNNWDTAGLPPKLKIIRDAESYTNFSGATTYDALLLSDLDEKKDKDFKDIDLATLKLTDLDTTLVVTDYWEEGKKKEKKENKK